MTMVVDDEDWCNMIAVGGDRGGVVMVVANGGGYCCLCLVVNVGGDGM